MELGIDSRIVAKWMNVEGFQLNPTGDAFQQT
jgi:hypothetical protein